MMKYDEWDVWVYSKPLLLSMYAVGAKPNVTQYQNDFWQAVRKMFQLSFNNIPQDRATWIIIELRGPYYKKRQLKQYNSAFCQNV